MVELFPGGAVVKNVKPKLKKIPKLPLAAFHWNSPADRVNASYAANRLPKKLISRERIKYARRPAGQVKITG